MFLLPISCADSRAGPQYEQQKCEVLRFMSERRLNLYTCCTDSMRVQEGAGMSSNTIALVLEVKILELLKTIENIHLAKFIEKWPSQPGATRQVEASPLPVISRLAEISCREGDRFSEVLTLLKESAGHLHWGQTYTAHDFGEAFLDNYGWTEIIGQRGPIKSTEIACGFLLLGPHIEYPLHRHEAEEIYVPLSSGALWKLGDADWMENPRGEPIYHRHWVAHGMRTGASPLLALYIWHGGDLAQKSVIE